MWLIIHTKATHSQLYFWPKKHKLVSVLLTSKCLILPEKLTQSLGRLYFWIATFINVSWGYTFNYKSVLITENILLVLVTNFIFKIYFIYFPVWSIFHCLRQLDLQSNPGFLCFHCVPPKYILEVPFNRILWQKMFWWENTHTHTHIHTPPTQRMDSCCT